MDLIEIEKMIAEATVKLEAENARLTAENVALRLEQKMRLMAEESNARLREELALSRDLRRSQAQVNGDLSEQLAAAQAAVKKYADLLRICRLSKLSRELDAAIDSAMKEAQWKQEPVGEVTSYHTAGMYDEFPIGTPLYAAPVVQPGMVRPDQEALQQIIAAALYDFGGFITTRQKQLVASATDNAADTVEALKEFMEKRGINPCQDVPVLSWQCWIASADGKK